VPRDYPKAQIGQAADRVSVPTRRCPNDDGRDLPRRTRVTDYGTFRCGVVTFPAPDKVIQHPFTQTGTG
jgi:hypothetical protein